MIPNLSWGSRCCLPNCARAARRPKSAPYIPKSLLLNAAARYGREGYGIETGAAYQRAVNLRFGEQPVAILRLHASTIQNAQGLGLCGRKSVPGKSSDEAVRGGSLLGCGHAARTDGPNRLVRHQNTGELRGGQTLESAVELAGQHFFHAAPIALGQRFADADDGTQPGAERGAKFAVNLVVGLLEDVAPLGVPNQSVVATGLGDHGGGDLSGPGAFFFPVEVLRGDGDLGSARSLD